MHDFSVTFVIREALALKTADGTRWRALQGSGEFESGVQARYDVSGLVVNDHRTWGSCKSSSGGASRSSD